MGDLILGPAGALPPGRWAVGAQVVDGPNATIPRTIYDANSSGEVQFIAQMSGRRAGYSRLGAKRLCLNLTTGPLDFGTRALLALVAPGEEQPDNAPVWRSCGSSWALQSFYSDGRASTVWFGETGDLPWSADVAKAINNEPNPRRALALALAAAVEE